MVDAALTHHTRQASVATRLRCLLLGWGSVGMVYGLTTALAGHLGAPTVLRETALDRWLPFNPAAIWAYLLFFVLIPYAYAVVRSDRLRPLQHAMQLSALLCGAVFLAWPTTLVYPPVAGQGASLAMLRLLLVADTPYNCLPSLHGALTLLCMAALTERQRPWHTAAVWMLGAGICVSVVVLRRHLSGDLAAGLAVAAGSLYGVAWLRNKGLRQSINLGRKGVS